VQVHPAAGVSVDLTRVAEHLRGVAGDVELTAHLLRFSIEGCRFSVFRGGRAIVFGTDDPQRARILYDRYVGAR
jgi:adenylyltransferase/sulfurtransferase